jgi:hypothetical protein
MAGEAKIPAALRGKGRDNLALRLPSPLAPSQIFSSPKFRTGGSCGDLDLAVRISLRSPAPNQGPRVQLRRSLRTSTTAFGRVRRPPWRSYVSNPNNPYLESQPQDLIFFPMKLIKNSTYTNNYVQCNWTWSLYMVSNLKPYPSTCHQRIHQPYLIHILFHMGLYYSSVSIPSDTTNALSHN